MHYHLCEKEEIKYYEKTCISCFISNYEEYELQEVNNKLGALKKAILLAEQM